MNLKDPEWQAKHSLINQQDLLQKEMVIDKTNISAWFSERQPLSTPESTPPRPKKRRPCRRPPPPPPQNRNIRVIMSEIVDKRQKQKSSLQKTLGTVAKCSYFNYPTRETFVSKKRRDLLERPLTSNPDKLCIRTLSRDYDRRATPSHKFYEPLIIAQSYTFKKFPQRPRFFKPAEKKDRRPGGGQDELDGSICNILNQLNERMKVREPKSRTRTGMNIKRNSLPLHWP